MPCYVQVFLCCRQPYIVPLFHSMTKAAAVDGGNALYQVQTWQWQKCKTENLQSMVMLDELCAD